MSFIRALIALLIAAGIGYGLYTAVEQQRAKDSATAERASLADPATDGGTMEAMVSEPETVETGDAAVTEETDTDTDTDTDTATGSDSDATSEGADTAPPAELPAATAQDQTAEAGQNDGQNEPVGASDSDSLPAASIAETTSDSVDALRIVSGGMSYSEARVTLIEAGWTPRAVEIANRRNADSLAVEGLLALDYVELEGCSEGDRTVCRFEFVDGADRIAAVLTAGDGENPRVIDAFLMDIKQGE